MPIPSLDLEWGFGRLRFEPERHNAWRCCAGEREIWIHQNASETWRASLVFRLGVGATAQEALEALRLKLVTDYAALGAVLGASTTETD